MNIKQVETEEKRPSTSTLDRKVCVCVCVCGVCVCRVCVCVCVCGFWVSLTQNPKRAIPPEPTPDTRNPKPTAQLANQQFLQNLNPEP